MLQPDPQARQTAGNHGLPLSLWCEACLMKCPKCRYTSFSHLEHCPKCGFGLAEQRAALGIYAIRADPPDLRLAYQATSLEVPGQRLSAPVSPPGLDLSPFEGIDPEGSEVESSGSDAAGPEAATTAMDLASAERLDPQDMVKSHAQGLHHLGDIAMALESGADVADDSPLNLQAPEEITQVTPVYDLDVDDELSHLPLGPIVDESGADEEDEEALEYTLEIDEDLEFEVEGLALDQDEKGGDEDDDER